LAPVQRQGIEYEFDIVGDLDQDNNLVISKTRCKKLSKQVVPCPSRDFALMVKEWLEEGEEATLSDQQRKDLWDAAKSAGWSADGLKNLLIAKQIDSGSTRDIPSARLREFHDYIQDMGELLEFNQQQKVA
jgi:hypothetical protein